MTDSTVAPWVAIVGVKLMLAAVVGRQGREIVVEVPPVLSLNMNSSSLRAVFTERAVSRHR